MSHLAKLSLPDIREQREMNTVKGSKRGQTGSEGEQTGSEGEQRHFYTMF